MVKDNTDLYNGVSIKCHPIIMAHIYIVLKLSRIVEDIGIVIYPNIT